jgi:hypothetical protein
LGGIATISGRRMQRLGDVAAGTLEAESRLAVFSEIATGFRKLVEFPEQATPHLTDEQYLWNVVEILYERSRIV